jgi:murein L,D-transpeptidase YcbB/YkuD
MVLAEFVLKEGLDDATVVKLEACMKDQKPSEFPLKRRMPVLIFYMTAAIDENGDLKFYNDVYKIEGKDMSKAPKEQASI